VCISTINKEINAIQIAKNKISTLQKKSIKYTYKFLVIVLERQAATLVKRDSFLPDDDTKLQTGFQGQHAL
jgi:hypothetical protein